MHSINTSSYEEEKRNWLVKLEIEYKAKDVIDLEGVEITRAGLDALSEYIVKDGLLLYRIKEVKTTSYHRELTLEDFTPLVEAFKKNSDIVSFTTNYRIMGSENEGAIRLQLMLNKARHFIRGKQLGYFWDSYYYISFGWFVGRVVAFLFPSISMLVGATFFIPALYAINQFYDYSLKKAKLYDYTAPLIIGALKPGQDCASSFCCYLNPKAWTPLAYLGFAIKNNQYDKKYKVEVPCFISKDNTQKP